MEYQLTAAKPWSLRRMSPYLKVHVAGWALDGGIGHQVFYILKIEGPKFRASNPNFRLK